MIPRTDVLGCVADHITGFPERMVSRQTVLHWLLTVQGTGAVWDGGVLHTPRIRPTRTPRISAKQRLATHMADFIRYLPEGTSPDAPEVAPLRSQARIAAAEATLAAQTELLMVRMRQRLADDLAQDMRPYTGTLFLSEHSGCIASVPDDIHPDWLAAVREVLYDVYLSHIPPFFSKASVAPPVDPATVQRQAAQLQIAQQLLTELAERFGALPDRPADFALWKDSILAYQRHAAGEIFAVLKGARTAT